MGDWEVYVCVCVRERESEVASSRDPIEDSLECCGEGGWVLSFTGPVLSWRLVPLTLGGLGEGRG